MPGSWHAMASSASRDPHFFKEHGIAHHRPDTLLLWEADTADHVEDVTGFVDAKLEALEAHESQFESTMKANRRRSDRRVPTIGIRRAPGRTWCRAWRGVG